MKSPTVSIRLTLNGQALALEIPAVLTALQLLRDELGLKGTKEGCGIGECGACTIQVDGRAVNACLLLAAQLDGREVTTVEGLNPEDGLHPIQEAFLERHGVQCGFCTPGVLMSTDALLKENPQPDGHAVKAALAGNLCRCTGYQQIFDSVQAAADKLKGGRHAG